MAKVSLPNTNVKKGCLILQRHDPGQDDPTLLIQVCYFMISWSSPGVLQTPRQNVSVVTLLLLRKGFLS